MVFYVNRYITEHYQEFYPRENDLIAKKFVQSKCA